MAEEDVAVEAPAVSNPSSSPVATTDHKRKLQDLEPEETQKTYPSDAGSKSDDVANEDSVEAKRVKIDESKSDGLANENGFGKESLKEDNEENRVENEQEEGDDGVEETGGEKEVDGEERVEDLKAVDEADVEKQGDEEKEATEKEEWKEKEEGREDETAHSSKEEEEEEEELDDTQTTTRKIEVPNDKVGVLIGKGGDTIRYLQYNSGAKIQITRDMDADPRSTARPVELIGTLSSIRKAEKLIAAVIAEADAGGSPSLVARGLPSTQSSSIADQIEMQVPNEKVGLIIGRGGDTIKALQAKSGARIQVLIPQHLPEGDGSKERTVRVSGDRRQIEMAKEMIKDVMSQNVKPSPLSGSGYSQQQSYRPHGPTGPSHWGPRGSHSSQASHYDYHHRGPYPPQNSQYPPSYGGYPPHHMGPRGSYGSGWEQRPPNMQGPVSHGGGSYDYYGGHPGHVSDHPSSAPISNPIHGHAPGPSVTPGMGHPPPTSYGYGQQHGLDYGHQAPYPQSVPHGYESHPQTHHTYGPGNPQPVYQQGGNQPGYGVQQQYGKPPSYGMPSQGPPQSYAPRPGQPDVPYQTPMQPSQSYVSNVPSQQQYPYASSGPMQQSYPPYGATAATDGYNQALPASGTGYPPQGGQSVPSGGYGQAAGQQAGAYAQGPGGYGSYPSSQQGYPEQPAQNSAGYGYQGSQDPAYATGPGSAYTAPAVSQQGYAQPTPAQPGYDQSVPQSGAYAAAAVPVTASAPASYGKTVSPQPQPQPSYPQYDSTQMYAAPR